jgi:ABC-type uncharacterized transport system permease subunit
MKWIVNGLAFIGCVWLNAFALVFLKQDQPVIGLALLMVWFACTSILGFECAKAWDNR